MLNSSKISLLDAATWQTIRNRDLIGLYSLETEWARKLISKIMPETFDELVAVVAVARPMPLDMGLHVQLESNKHHPESIDYIFPELKPVLQTFYGIILFVEQVEEIGSLVAGFNEKETKKLIKVLTSQKKRAVEKIRKLFIHKAENRSFDREKSAALFDKLATHVPCCVNKARLVSITTGLYYCAFLKTHHAPAYMAAVMTVDCRDPDRMRVLTGECRRLEITMQPPDINASERHFSLEGNSIVFGLASVVQVKDDFRIRILQQRAVAGRFRDLEDFNNRVRISENDAPAVESLMACGAFDSICDTPKKTLEQQLDMEKDFFGYYISGHPLDFCNPMEKTISISQLKNKKGRPAENTVRILCQLTLTCFEKNRSGAWSGVGIIEDQTHTMNVLIPPGIIDETNRRQLETSPVIVQVNCDSSGYLTGNKITKVITL